MDLSPAAYVQIEGTQVRVQCKTLAELKIAIKELKLKKKEFNLIKRNINEKQKSIRAAYTNEVRSRGSMVRGGGGLGRFFRALQSISRDRRRSNFAAQLEPV
jgi:hypothetical protein